MYLEEVSGNAESKGVLLQVVSFVANMPSEECSFGTVPSEECSFGEDAYKRLAVGVKSDIIGLCSLLAKKITKYKVHWNLLCFRSLRFENCSVTQ